MGAHQAFLNLPDETAVAEITRLVQAKNFDALIDGLRAVQGDIEQRLHVELSNCYAAIHDRLQEKASQWAQLETEARAAGETAAATKARNTRDKLARQWVKAGKKDVLNELHALRPDLWAYQNAKSERWRTEMWRKSGVDWLPQARPG